MIIQYDVSQPFKNTIGVSIVFKYPANNLRLSLAVWRPGKYERKNFASYLSPIKAFANDKPLNITCHSPHEWIIENRNMPEIRIEYSVQSSPLEVDSCYVTPHFALINPIACTLYPENVQEIEISVKSNYKTSQILYQNGQLPTTLNIHELFDSVILCSNSITETFENQTTKFYLHIESHEKIDSNRIKNDILKFVIPHNQLFQDAPEHYHIFLIKNENGHYHGLEHSGGNIDLFNFLEVHSDKNYEKLISMLSHEYFHYWNIKQIKPADLSLDFSAEPFTSLIHVIEGFTSYFGDLALFQSGVWSLETFLNHIEQKINKYAHNPACLYISIQECSQMLWAETKNSLSKLNIYDSGFLLAFLLDILLISKGHRLSDVMKRLYTNEYMAHGYTSNDIEEILYEIGDEQIAKQWKLWTENAKMLPLSHILPTIGLSLNPINKSYSGLGSLGIGFEKNTLKVNNVDPYLIASQIGIQINDVIITCQNKTMYSPTEIECTLSELHPNTPIIIEVIRNDRLIEVYGYYKSLTITNFMLGRMKVMDKTQQSLFNIFNTNIFDTNT